MPLEALLDRLRTWSEQVPQPKLNLIRSRHTDYEAVGRIIYSAMRFRFADGSLLYDGKPPGKHRKPLNPLLLKRPLGRRAARRRRARLLR
jgi:hypothetical protein